MHSNIHLRNVDDQLLRQLKRQAANEEISVNTLILNLLRQSLHLECSPKFKTYDDLDKLAGTWSKKQSKNFTNILHDFEKIDKDIWR
jgi:plasmid stability protein